MAQILMNLDKVSAALAGKIIFQEVDWEIQNRQRIGLVGPNGAGKSTLMKLMAAELTAASGAIYRQPNLTWARLEQEPQMSDGRTVFQEALTAVPQLTTIETQLHHLENRMADPHVYNDPLRLEKVMQQHGRTLDDYERLDGPRYESRVKEALSRAGLEETDWPTPTHLLSGGQKKLVLLAKLIILQPKLLLLDEPDNHLDVPAKE